MAAAFEKKEKIIALLACILCTISPFVSDSYTPSFPAITAALHTTANQIQLTITLYFLGASFSQLIYGPLSEKYGRRIMVLTGLGICILGSLLCMFSISAGMLIAARFIQGFGAGATNGLFRSILRDTFNGIKLVKIGSYIGVIFPITFAAAPIIGGYVQHYLGWRENFGLITFLTFTTLLLIWRFLIETHHNTHNVTLNLKSISKHYVSLLKHPDFMCYTLLSSFALSGFICYYAAAPFLLENIAGLNTVQFGWSCLSLAAGIMISQYLNVCLIKKYDTHFLLSCGVFLMFLSGIAMLTGAYLFKINAYNIIIPAFIFSLSAGFIYPNAMAGAFESFGHIAGFAGALYSFFQLVIPVFMSMLIAIFHENNQLPLAFIFTGIGLMSGVIMYNLYMYNLKKKLN